MHANFNSTLNRVLGRPNTETAIRKYLFDVRFEILKREGVRYALAPDQLGPAGRAQLRFAESRRHLLRKTEGFRTG